MLKHSISVLLIQDKSQDYETIRRDLYLNPGHQYNFSLSVRNTVEEGLDAIVREAPDVVLLDVSLLESDGVEHFRNIRARAMNVPLIVLTGSHDERAALRLAEDGAQDYFVKGDFPGLLGRTIAQSILRNDLLRQISESERVTRQQSLNRAAFFDNMSHEIRTPLTSVIGYAETLLRSKLDPKETEKALQSIFSNGKHLLKVINNILDLSKIEAGQMKIERNREKIQPMLRDVLRTFASRAKEKGLNLSVSFEGPVPAELETDSFRVKQILLNLVGNAVKFTGEGFVKLIVRADTLSNTVTFEVKDSGVGIPEEAKAQLFKNFSQGQQSVAKNYGGSGLGLAICEQLARQLGGSIDFYSRKGVGSVFSLNLPLDQAGRESMTSEPPSLEDAGENFVPKEAVNNLTGRALIVDDFEDNRELLSLLLRQAGMTVDVACDGEEALQKIAGAPFDILLLDMQMPRMDGRQVARALRSQGRTMPIVAVTASVLDESINECLRAGCDACLRKPFEQEELLDCVAQFLSQGAKADKGSDGPSVRDDELSAVRQSFKKKLPKLISEIEDAYHSGDLEKLKAQAHRMVGAGLFGFRELSHLGGVLETIIIQEQTGGLGLIESLVRRIGNEMGKIGLQPKNADGTDKGDGHSSNAAIIVIDDDEVNLKVVCRTLSAKGFLVAPARNEEDALQLCKDGPFALLVVSLDVSHFEAAALVQKLRTKMESQVPVIYMTTRSMSEISSSLTIQNVEQILIKPIQRDRLFEAIDSLVSASLASA